MSRSGGGTDGNTRTCVEHILESVQNRIEAIEHSRVVLIPTEPDPVPEASVRILQNIDTQLEPMLLQYGLDLFAPGTRGW